MRVRIPPPHPFMKKFSLVFCLILIILLSVSVGAEDLIFNGLSVHFDSQSPVLRDEDSGIPPGIRLNSSYSSDADLLKEGASQVISVSDVSGLYPDFDTISISATAVYGVSSLSIGNVTADSFDIYFTPDGSGEYFVLGNVVYFYVTAVVGSESMVVPFASLSLPSGEIVSFVPPPPVSESSILSFISDFLVGVISWMCSFVLFLSAHPLILMCVLLSFCAFALYLIKRCFV